MLRLLLTIVLFVHGFIHVIGFAKAFGNADGILARSISKPLDSRRGCSRLSPYIAWGCLSIRQVFQAQTIFAGSLRKLKAELFDAILVLEPDLASPFISLQTSPMPINQTLLQQAAEHWQAAHHIPPKPLWTILIGGAGAGAVYQDSDWQTLAEQLNTLAEKHSIQWLLTTSRRTGSRAEQILRQHLKTEVLADAVWWSLQQPAVTPTVTHPVTYSVTLAYLALSDMVFCTVDSMSMMMESISAMRPVISLIPEQFKPDANFQAAIDRLQQQKLVVQIKIDGLAQQSEQFMQLQPLSQEPCLKLADMLQKRLSKTQ
ncbi:MAG: nucleoside-diphosphate sugar epimerase [Sphingobacteriales bacterium]|nr:MAG: nucleoside-diphosphate sugar epimerase [Sphingobacteriales bacterium]